MQRQHISLLFNSKSWCAGTSGVDAFAEAKEITFGKLEMLFNILLVV